MNNLVELRKENTMTQKALSEYLGISQGNLCDWEKGRSEPDIATLIKIANYFGVSVDFLVGNADYEGFIKYREDTSNNASDILLQYNTLSIYDKELVQSLIYRLRKNHENK